MMRRLAWLAAACLLAGTFLPTSAEQPGFDLVIAGGRVIDPESGFDAVADVGIRDGRIASISTQRLPGAQVIDATARVVAPGFIDLHSHLPTPLGQRYQVLDGVTTALELEPQRGLIPLALPDLTEIDLSAPLPRTQPELPMPPRPPASVWRSCRPTTGLRRC